MKLFISADIEGVAGISAPPECRIDDPQYTHFREQMTAEVAAACEAAVAAGASTIVVKDAHGTGRNLHADSFPTCVELISGWSGHPDTMMFGLDSSFDAALMVGYHSGAGSGGNPLAHTFSSASIQHLKINGVLASEFRFNTLVARNKKVPVVFISGDTEICEEAKDMDEQIISCPVLTGFGGAARSIHPDLACERIRAGVTSALSVTPADYEMFLPDEYCFEVTFKSQKDAYRASYFPGASLLRPDTSRFISRDLFAAQQFLMFVK